MWWRAKLFRSNEDGRFNTTEFTCFASDLTIRREFGFGILDSLESFHCAIRKILEISTNPISRTIIQADSVVFASTTPVTVLYISVEYVYIG